MRNLTLALVLAAFSMPAFAEDAPAGGGHVAKGADAQAVDQACTADAATAGCGSEQVGTGLMKCLHAYKKAHKKDFKLSDGCKAAMEKMHADHKGKKKS